MTPKNQHSPSRTPIANYALAAVAALILPALVFITLPLGIINDNLSELQIGWPLYSPFIWAFVIALAALVPVFVWSTARGNKLARVVILIAVNIMFWDALRGPFIDYNMSAVVAFVLEIVFFAASVLILFKMTLSNVLTLAAVIGLAQPTLAIYNHSQIVDWDQLLLMGEPSSSKMEFQSSLADIQSFEHLKLPTPIDFAEPIIVDGTPTIVPMEDGAVEILDKTIIRIPFLIEEPTGTQKFFKVRIEPIEGCISLWARDENDRNLTIDPVIQSNAGPTVCADFDETRPRQIHEEYLMLAEDKNKGVLQIEQRWDARPAKYILHSVELFRTGDIKAADASAHGNVYHLILDGFQKEYFLQFADDYKDTISSDYAFFPNFSSISDSTYLSLSLTLSPMKRWIQPDAKFPIHMHMQSDGLFDQLWRAGVQVHQYPYSEDYCMPYASRCKPLINYKKDYLSTRSNFFVYDLVFLSWLPVSLWANLADVDQDAVRNDWHYGFSITSMIPTSDIGQENMLKTTTSDTLPFSVEHFKTALQEEATRPATGQYVFMHGLVPHEPYMMNEECEYVVHERDIDRTKLYIKTGAPAQHRCALKMVEMLRDRLKELGRFDDATIIVHGDHGSFYDSDLGGEPAPCCNPAFQAPPPKIDFYGTTPWPSPSVDIKSSTLLLAKLPDSFGAVDTSAPVQSIDIAPTILKSLDIEPHAFEGLPLSEPINRNKTFFVHDYYGKPKQISRYQYRDQEWSFIERFDVDLR